MDDEVKEEIQTQINQEMLRIESRLGLVQAAVIEKDELKRNAEEFSREAWTKVADAKEIMRVLGFDDIDLAMRRGEMGVATTARYREYIYMRQIVMMMEALANSFDEKFQVGTRGELSHAKH